MSRPSRASGTLATSYAETAARAAATITATAPAAARAADRIEAAAVNQLRAIRIASLFSVIAGLALLVPDTAALAQGGGGGGDVSFDEGANQIFDIVGTVALIAGFVVGIGSLFMKRVMAALGFGLGGALIWAMCQNPEDTIGAFAQWIIERFTNGSSGGN